MRISDTIRQKARKLNKKSWLLLAAAAFLFTGMLFTVYAKYYKTGYNKGMAIASGFYFSSNYMAAHEEIKGLSMEEIAASYRNTLIASSYNWHGTNTAFTKVEIRNYDSWLLYNDQDLNVEYQVNFMLLDEPAGAEYSVKYGTETKRLTFADGKGTAVSFTGTLQGGSPAANSYELTVKRTTGDYAPADILMAAYPVGPDYLVGTKCLAGILQFDYTEKEFAIENSGFAVQKTWNPASWKEAVAKESGFIYEVITSGSYMGSDAAATRKRIQLKWDASLFKINANDPYYLAVKDDQDAYYEITEDGTTWQVMEIEVLPYASLKFVFFRNEEFEDRVNAMTDSADFEKTVQAVVLQ